MENERVGAEYASSEYLHDPDTPRRMDARSGELFTV